MPNRIRWYGYGSEQLVRLAREANEAEERLMEPITVGMAIKLGSIARHAEELLSPEGHAFDRVALEALLSDPEVVEWMAAADAAALLPVRR